MSLFVPLARFSPSSPSAYPFCLVHLPFLVARLCVLLAVFLPPTSYAPLPRLRSSVGNRTQHNASPRRWSLYFILPSRTINSERAASGERIGPAPFDHAMDPFETYALPLARGLSSCTAATRTVRHRRCAARGVVFPRFRFDFGLRTTGCGMREIMYVRRARALVAVVVGIACTRTYTLTEYWLPPPRIPRARAHAFVRSHLALMHPADLRAQYGFM